MKTRIFVSAVSREFKSARVKVEHALEFLGFEVVQQDIWGTEPGDLRQMLRDKIDSCEGVLQLAGAAYGAEPKVVDEKYGRVSYTQFEFLHARDTGKKTWLVFPTDTCPRDTPIEELDLPLDPEHPDPAAYQAERRELQKEYLAARRADGHVYWSCGADPELEHAVLKIRADSEELRKEYRLWQDEVRAGLQRIEEKLEITEERLRARLREASGHALAKDLAEADAVVDRVQPDHRRGQRGEGERQPGPGAMDEPVCGIPDDRDIGGDLGEVEEEGRDREGEERERDRQDRRERRVGEGQQLW